MIKRAFLRTSTVLLSLTLAGGIALAQQGTEPDPRAGQSGDRPVGAPTNTPQAQQNASPAANTTPQGNAATQPSAAQAPAPTPNSSPAQDSRGTQQNPPPHNVPQSDNPPSTADVELSQPVSGPPVTKIFEASAIGKHTGVTGAPDPLLDVPPLPKGNPTLIGGTAEKVDRIRSRVVVEPFGSKKRMPIYLDERTHIYRNGVETTIEHIKKGDRVYFDTMLDGPRVFAKNVRVVSETGAAEVRGQITAYDPRRGTIELQDALSSRPVVFRLNNQTRIAGRQGSASTADLGRGALVDVHFAPDRANRGLATEITILARPGASYTFAGRITNLNLRDGIVSVENTTDGKVYDIEVAPRGKNERAALHVGNTVNITATFDGENYRANNVTVTQAQSNPRPQTDQPRPNPDDQP